MTILKDIDSIREEIANIESEDKKLARALELAVELEYSDCKNALALYVLGHSKVVKTLADNPSRDDLATLEIIGHNKSALPSRAQLDEIVEFLNPRKVFGIVTSDAKWSRVSRIYVPKDLDPKKAASAEKEISKLEKEIADLTEIIKEDKEDYEIVKKLAKSKRNKRDLRFLEQYESDMDRLIKAEEELKAARQEILDPEDPRPRDRDLETSIANVTLMDNGRAEFRAQEHLISLTSTKNSPPLW